MLHSPGDETAHLLNRYLLPTITVCVGTFLSIVGFVLMLHVGIERLEKEFTAAAKFSIQVTSHWLESRTQDVQSIERLYLASAEVTSDEFRSAAADLISVVYVRAECNIAHLTKD